MALVNLGRRFHRPGQAGARERKAVLRSSRVHITRELGVARLKKLEDGPKTNRKPRRPSVYYGNRGDEVLTEEKQGRGDGFSGEIGKRMGKRRLSRPRPWDCVWCALRFWNYF